MRFAPLLLAFLLELGTALALSVQARDGDFAAGTATCSSWTLGDERTYHVRIGAPLIGDAGCEGIHNAIKNRVPEKTWNCQGDGQNNTQLMFTTGRAMRIQSNWLVMEQLDQTYPDVGFLKNRICLAPSFPANTAWPFKRNLTPAPTHSLSLAPNSAVCSTGTDGEWRTYFVRVGVPYNYQVGCDVIHNAFADFVNVQGFMCASDGSVGDRGQVLTFRVHHGEDQWLNQRTVDGLQFAFPTVPFRKDRICLAPGFQPPNYWPTETKRSASLIEPTTPVDVRPYYFLSQGSFGGRLGKDSALCKVKHTYGAAGSNHTVDYFVQIGQPFHLGTGCRPINETVKQAGGDVATIRNFRCVPVSFDFDNTGLAFTMQYDVGSNHTAMNEHLVEQLQVAYPMVPFKNLGICAVQSETSPPSPPTLAGRGMDNVAQHTALCTVDDLNTDPKEMHGIHYQYNFLVGHPYLAGATCQGVLAKIQMAPEVIVLDFQCTATTDGQTSIRFAIYYDSYNHSQGEVKWSVLDRMRKAFPSVSFSDLLCTWPLRKRSSDSSIDVL
jgi:hypothetical protein